MTRTILTKKEQAQYLSDNWQSKVWTHVWSSRGYGNSKIRLNNGDIIGKASGCGYDRFGAALGNAIEHLFPNELNKLAKAKCRGKSRTRKGSADFYGLFYNAKEKRAYVDGACGDSCMRAILNKIGFSFKYISEDDSGNNGVVMYTIEPLSKHERRYLK